jgi:hypothetical protein
LAFLLACAGFAAVPAAALANNKKEAPPPAPHPSAAPAPHMAAPAMPHLPGGLPGGVHMPGQAAAGVHVPASVQTGVHVPSAVAAHVPSAVHPAVAAHAPSAVHPAVANHGVMHGQPPAPQHAVAQRAAPQHAQVAHGDVKTPMPAHPAPMPAAAGHAGRLAAIHDPRVGGSANLHTRGIEQGMTAPHPPRPYLRADPHRDIASDRAFVMHHAGDFHTRDVRGFNPHELALWRAGNWHNEWHYGRRGWWWQADGVWYPYPEPLWPYPEQVAVLTVYEAPTYDGPDLSALEVPPPASADAPPPAPADAPPPEAAAPAAQAPELAATPGPAPAADPATGQVMAAASIPPLPPAPVGWYRCSSPSGYFPALTTCAESWDLVQNAPLPGDQ